ncbi:hypothetical protein CALVIDRAFT_559475 [Calocera viscosa TUFC12733]|uniref:Uncharacterized protein n=1 Tax=Calocera viscosa (strain TUFC12733) TaxID=1330018 RepID=A0A167S8H1_CALVF|nr:hypothetical protein CALVIDRAFT_559475 [Calocera viscosa TUFC12733]
MSQQSFGPQGGSTLHTIPYGAPPPNKSHRNTKPNIQQQQTFIHHVEEVHMPIEESKKDRKERKTREAAEKLMRYAQEQWEKRDEIFGTELALPTQGYQALLTYPPTNGNFQLALYQLSLIRAAAHAQIDKDEEYALESAEAAWEDERKVIEEEWKKGREEARQRMIAGIAEGRRKAKEELEAQDIAELGALDAGQPRQTRKLRGQVGSGPPSPPSEPASGKEAPPAPLPKEMNHAQAILGLSGPPETNALSLTNGIPSKYTLPLSNGRESKKAKGSQAGSNGRWSLGKAVPLLDKKNEGELEADMAAIRNGGKKRRIVAEKDRLGSTVGLGAGER